MMRCIFIPVKGVYIDIDTLKCYSGTYSTVLRLRNTDIDFINISFVDAPREVAHSDIIEPLNLQEMTVYSYGLEYYNFKNYEFMDKDTYIRVFGRTLCVWYNGFIFIRQLYDGVSDLVKSSKFSEPYFTEVYKENGILHVKTMMEEFSFCDGEVDAVTMPQGQVRLLMRPCPVFNLDAIRRYMLFR